MTAPHSNDVPRSDLVATLADLDEAVPYLSSASPDANTLMRRTASGKAQAQDATGGTELVNWRQAEVRYAPKTHTHDVPDINATGRTTSNFLRGDGTWATPTNTTYSVMSEAEATAGTATTARTTSASGLKGAIQRWATGSYSTAISAIGQALNKAATAAEARSAIGAGTSDLTLGTTSTTARAGNWVPTWSDVTSKPTSFPPSTHTHETAQVTGLQAELDGKASAARPGVEVWYGTAAEYNALPTATRNAAGFIAVLT